MLADVIPQIVCTASARGPSRLLQPALVRVYRTEPRANLRAWRLAQGHSSRRSCAARGTAAGSRCDGERLLGGSARPFARGRIPMVPRRCGRAPRGRRRRRSLLFHRDRHRRAEASSKNARPFSCTRATSWAPRSMSGTILQQDHRILRSGFRRLVPSPVAVGRRRADRRGRCAIAIPSAIGSGAARRPERRRIRDARTRLSAGAATYAEPRARSRRRAARGQRERSRSRRIGRSTRRPGLGSGGDTCRSSREAEYAERCTWSTSIPHRAVPTAARALAEELAPRAALAIDNSRLYEREHRVASALQRAMLPARLPSHERIEMSYAYRPAERESRVGGDWYDASIIAGDRVARLDRRRGRPRPRSGRRDERSAPGPSAERARGHVAGTNVQRANVALMLNEEHPIITAIVRSDRSSHARRSSTRARGIRRRRLRRCIGPARYLAGGGIPLGVDAAAPFPALEVSLEPYATLLLYTDGLIEFGRNIERESVRLLDAMTARVCDITRRRRQRPRALHARRAATSTTSPSSRRPSFLRDPDAVELRLPAAPSSAAIARRLALRFASVAKLGPRAHFRPHDRRRRSRRQRRRARLSRHDRRFRAALDGARRYKYRRRGAGSRDLARAEPADAERGRGLAILRATTSRFELDHSPKAHDGRLRSPGFELAGALVRTRRADSPAPFARACGRRMSSSRGLQTSTLAARAREIATLKRLRSKRNSTLRGTSSPLEVAIE